MSNRARRRSLRKMRLRAIFAFGASSLHDFESMEDMNRWQRFAFRAACREPLRFADNARSDPGLIDIQARNQPALFNPLRDPVPERPEHLKEYGNRNDPLFLWQKTEAAISDALQYLEPARRPAVPRFDWAGWAWWRNNPEHPNAPKDKTNNDPAAGWLEYCKDFPAEFHLGFLRLRVGMMAVHQYGDRGRWFRDHGQAARSVLRVDQFKEQITEAQIYALLTLAACWWALDALHELPQEPEHWPSWKLDYTAGLVHDAERWLAEAYRIEQGDARELLVLAGKEAVEEAAAAMAPDAELGKELRGRLADMQEAAKLTNTRYPDSYKAEWREYDRRHMAEATRTLNDSDRVRAVLKEFKLPKTASRTVLRALIGQ